MRMVKAGVSATFASASRLKTASSTVTSSLIVLRSERLARHPAMTKRG